MAYEEPLDESMAMNSRERKSFTNQISLNNFIYNLMILTSASYQTHKFIEKYIIIFVVSFFISYALSIRADVRSKQYVTYDFDIPSEWFRSDSEKLLKMSYTFQHSQKQDSAILGFSIICSRYKDNLPDREKEIILIAHNNRGLLYFNSYDFQRSYSDFVSALNISKRLPNTPHIANIYNNLASLNFMAGELNHSDRMIKDAYNYWFKSFEHSIDCKDGILPIIVYTNLTSNWFDYDSYNKILDITDSFSKIINDYDTSILNKFCKERILAIQSIKTKNWSSALKHFQRQLLYIDPQIEEDRFKAQAFTDIAKVYQLTENYEQALKYYYKVDSIAGASNLKEIEVRNHLLLSQTLDKLGQSDKARTHLSQYYEKNDSLLTSYNLAHLNDIDFYSRVSSFEEELRENETRYRMLINIIIIVVSALLVLSIVIYYLLKTRKRLYESRQATIRRTREWLNSNSTPVVNAYKIIPEENLPTDESKKISYTGSKYATSPLDNDQKEKMIMKISEIIETSDELFSIDFSLSRLAEISGYKQNYVSQVINEYYGRNFNQVIATRRIKQACAMLSDSRHFGSMTMEYIANKVGFRSRSSLLLAFKREMGMSPSEFQKMVNSKLD